MRGIYYLLHRRPHVVGELRRLDHDPDVVAVTREAVGRPDDVILGDRPIEHPAAAKLFLHPLGDIEYAAFFFRSHILAPQKRIGVSAKLPLQGFVYPLSESYWLRTRGRH